MEPTTENPPKKNGCRVRILKEATIDNLFKGREIEMQIKRLMKNRINFESSHQSRLYKQNASTLKLLEESSQYPLFRRFSMEYEDYIERSLNRQEDIIRGLCGLEGPYQILLNWLEDPTTKTKPEELKKRYSNLRDDHASKITLLRKEEKVLTKLREQLISCQMKLRNAQAALQVTFRLDVDVPAREIKEIRTLRSMEKELLHRLDKSLRQCQALMIEENESRKQLQKGMEQLAAEVENFETQRAKVCNTVMQKVVCALNKYEMQSTNQSRAKRALVESVSPTFIDLPEVSLNNKDTVCIFKFPDFAEQLKDLGFSVTGTGLESIFKPVEEFHATTVQKITSECSLSQGTEHCSKSSSNDTENCVQNTSNPSKITPETVVKKSKQDLEKIEAVKKIQKKDNEVKKEVQQNGISVIQKLNRKTSPQPVQHEDESTSVSTKLTENRDSSDEDETPEHAENSVSSDEDEDGSPKHAEDSFSSDEDESLEDTENSDYSDEDEAPEDTENSVFSDEDDAPPRVRRQGWIENGEEENENDTPSSNPRQGWKSTEEEKEERKEENENEDECITPRRVPRQTCTRCKGGEREVEEAEEEEEGEEGEEQEKEYEQGEEEEGIKEVSVEDNGQNKSQSDFFPSYDHGIHLEQACVFKALVTHTSVDDNDLSFDRGQKLVQTHRANEEGIAFGYTRKYRYSHPKYGYFNIRQGRIWKPSTKNVFRKLFTSI